MIQKILIVKLSSIGDICHTLLVLPALKEAFPQAKISWVVEDKFSATLAPFSHLLKIITVDLSHPLKKWRHNLDSLKKLRREKYDLTIDFQGLLKSALLAFFSSNTKQSKRWGFSPPTAREQSHRLYHFHLPTTAEQLTINVSEKNLLLVEAIANMEGIAKDSSQNVPHTFYSIHPTHTSKLCRPTSATKNDESSKPIIQSLEHWTKDWKQKNKTSSKTPLPLIAINPWASFHTKAIPESVVATLASAIKEHFSTKPILIYGPGEVKQAKKWSEKYPLALAPLVPLTHLFELVKLFDFYIGTDSGPSYISQLMGTPTLVLFGPTNLERQFPPLDSDSNSTLISNPDITNASSKNKKRLFSQAIYATYDCPIILPPVITKPYRCLNKDCKDNQCMKHFSKSKDLEKVIDVIKTIIKSD